MTRYGGGIAEDRGDDWAIFEALESERRLGTMLDWSTFHVNRNFNNWGIPVTEWCIASCDEHRDGRIQA